MFILTSEVAAEAGVTTRSVSYAVDAGDIPMPMVLGRNHVWLRTELPALIEGLKRRAARSTWSKGNADTQVVSL